MKKLLIIIGLAVTFTSCKKWLDVNDNPNSATTDVPTAELRLPPLISQFAWAYEAMGSRSAFLTQQVAYTNSPTIANWKLTTWLSEPSGSARYPWQTWYTAAAVNVDPLITAAKKVDAWQYIGVAKIIKAWGFATMADFYGVLVYDQFADPTTYTPKYEDASYVQTKVLALLDEAIADLQKPQGPQAPALSKGDILNNGNLDSWIRLAYGIKARCLNHLSKKAEYNPQTILDLLAKAPQADNQSTILQYVDEVGVKDDSKASQQYGNIGASASTRFAKLYVDYLNNNYTGAPTGANNMPDPRIDTLLPRRKVGNSWYSTVGVNVATSAGPSTSLAYTKATDQFTNGDSAYVWILKITAISKDTPRVLSTGSWYTARGAKALLLTNAEMRFIEAEVKFRMGNKTDALTAYKAGIRSHMNIMGINPALIDAYLSSTSVVQDPGSLTMSHIMIQKFIAMSFSPENWVDMRRFDYCTSAGVYNEAAGIYKGFQRPFAVNTQAYPAATDWPRRFCMASYETDYNLTEMLKTEPDVTKPTYLSKPVWWDKP
ncbi:SusD/RagB family nutrient-binding outer membrane lipoprotein [Chitinophaga sp. Cy-1792]|uniref:SusD/RagB family nutrient-binding outer membrane lipoprotein n=1 Tax=Chitinophaga sp. Cy-1792 TaxID=2608339 RepID=UPI00141E4428|nr:SusD/RagB family nutrient-binding outer membrane lipoprotein [Chitinophaga sp. Cy-1792]NIG54032.1 SusD/RagB family nutrient-binding outer membrane lipoprotein [Chitinophaga sp. Cy-1792]